LEKNGDRAFSQNRLARVYFEGNTPQNVGELAFAGNLDSLIIYHKPEATGFTNPWHGYPMRYSIS
jgi:hypothetical protein